VHELSVATGILGVVERHAAGRRVTGVEVRCGALRQVVPRSLEFYWDVITRESVAAGSALELVHVPATLRCGACGRGWSPEIPWFRCPDCSSDDVAVEAGEELEVTSIMVEEVACTA
jgi:hydrogenase nickel incorporation protein HypA/HybF